MTQRDGDHLDPIDDLRDAWQDVVPPERSADLADADPATRATVAWLAAAWKTRPIPRPAIARPTRRWRRVAAAAALVVASAVVTFFVVRSRGDGRVSPPIESRDHGSGARAGSDAFAAVAATRAALTIPAAFPALAVADCNAARAPVERLSCAFRASRSGDYSDTIRYATPVADDPTASQADRCAALTHLVVAEYGLGRSDEAARQEERLVAALR